MIPLRSMALGPGKYDAACTAARTATKARGVLLIVFDGEHGNGFSCQAEADVLLVLPEILERTARDIRNDFRRDQ